jgi:hypothetical protein
MEHAVYKDFPVPAARDESLPQANGRESPSLNAAILIAQFGLSTGADYGQTPGLNRQDSYPHPVDCAVDDILGGTR